MDSRLLNVFHDDPLDGSYTQVNTDFWPNESDTMGQLTETLNGILPIPADADHDTGIYTSHLLATEDNFRIANNYDAHLQNKELLIYDEDFTQHELAADGDVEIITVNPNSLHSNSDSDSDDYDDVVELHEAEKDDNNKGMEYIEFDDDNRSQYSNATFRTRTESSSIGDYESHTSDYDDSSGEEEEDDANANVIKNNSLTAINTAPPHKEMLILTPHEMPDLTAGLLGADGIDLGTGYELPLEDIAVGTTNRRTISTNTIGSDLDVNNFDLAEFITNDNFTLNAAEKVINPSLTKAVKITVPTRRLTMPVKCKVNEDDSDSDGDSDIIVDIETVDVDAAQTLWNGTMQPAEILKENDISFVDNIKKDPSWSPKTIKKHQENVLKETKTRPTSTPESSTTPNPRSNIEKSRNFSIVPSKRQYEILKGKASVGKNKSSTKQIQGKLPTKKGPESTAGNAPKAGSLTCRVGVGQGGNNLDLVVEKNNNADEVDSKKQNKQKEDNKLNAPEPPTAKESKIKITKIVVIPKENIKTKTTDETKLAVKRKLNLEEYKQRRGTTPLPGQNNVVKADADNTSKSALQITQVKHNNAVTSVVQSLKNQTYQKPSTDPITVAKNKVLRMQELKRAQQLKIIDSTISAKVPRVTKLPPLKEIVKDTYLGENVEQNQYSSRLHPDYEELIILSAGNNTEISIPPHNILPINTCERSLLKSSALLYKLPQVLSSNSSLISSIQGVVVQEVIAPKKAHIKTNVVAGSKKVTSAKQQNTSQQHGEDKIIMHLRKDRIRPHTVSIAIQTDLQPGFEPLPKISFKKRKVKRNYRKRKDTLGESDSDVSFGQRSRQRSRTRGPMIRSRSRSAESFASSMERRSVARQSEINCGYTSSRGSRRHRSSVSSSYSESGRISRSTKRQHRTSYTKRTKRYSRNYSSSSSSSSSCSSDYSNRSRSRSRSRSHSRSRNRNRSRSRSPYYRRSYSRSRSRSRSRGACNRFRKPGGPKKFTNIISQPAVEERRIVYVGRIEEETTKEMLRRKFLPYGTIKQISIHYKDTGMKYGFVTYERSQDAFTVIDTSDRDPTINMYDISFGGRRAFCRSSYSDLDNAGINTYHSIVFPKVEAPPKEEDSFEALLQKVKAKMNANKGNSGTNTPKA
ncbi:uncharacterized protein srl [Eurosta solidaginis]|uniref:uncharacterized protein srl n=1 Tax=Eurosta solidaginis TaxID=178769 RepID=UPI0035314473